MSSIFPRVILVGAAALLLVGFGLAGGAAAQEIPNETANASEEIEEETGNLTDQLTLEDTEADTFENQQAIRLSQRATLLAWEFSGGEVKIAIHADRRTTVTLSDGGAGMDGAGATRIPTTDYLIETDETAILSFPVETVNGGHAVAVSDGGTGVRLTTDMAGDDPFRHFGGESGLFSGMALALLCSLGGAGWVLRNEDSGVMEA